MIDQDIEPKGIVLIWLILFSFGLLNLNKGQEAMEYNVWYIHN